MKMKCSLETAVAMVVGLSLVSQAAQPGIYRVAGQKTQLGKAPAEENWVPLSETTVSGTP